MLPLLLAAGDLTETDEDNRDDDESACGEGKTSTSVASINQRRSQKHLITGGTS